MTLGNPTLIAKSSRFHYLQGAFSYVNTFL